MFAEKSASCHDHAEHSRAINMLFIASSILLEWPVSSGLPSIYPPLILLDPYCLSSELSVVDRYALLI